MSVSDSKTENVHLELDPDVDLARSLKSITEGLETEACLDVSRPLPVIVDRVHYKSLLLKQRAKGPIQTS